MYHPELNLVIVVLALLGREMASALTMFDVWTYYVGVSCREVPKVIHAGNFSTCRDGCEYHSGDWTMMNEECQIADYDEIMADAFKNASYVVQETLTDDCETVLEAYAYIAMGSCELAIISNPYISESSSSGGGGASINSSSSTTSSTIGGSGLLHRRKRSKRMDSSEPSVVVMDSNSDKRTSSTQGGSTPLEGAVLGQSGLWNDDVITAKRIARREIEVGELVSRGAFGEVYEGVFKDKRVAVKMLSAETRGEIRLVNNFLAEAKLTASMDHPHVVHFIGVAWDTLSDLCVVMEYMEGGDLRSLLSEYEQSGHPVCIDREKATIALQVCHALTYLHSLSPPVIHRDLKSRNILLSRDFEAKLTDYGISREKLDQTMTAGVGTSLWMAPEVMLGEKYDDKADIFS
ncbi:TKL protein kinase [Phytophthora cinnamomi]|uniref:TKL protein kinase n=1 Tax=Phytophthora cinnamomi TaxID=4785 RepID=UPI00355950CC|nr:TKL protein kinase [Phytophthora cinnamomi]